MMRETCRRADEARSQMQLNSEALELRYVSAASVVWLLMLPFADRLRHSHLCSIGKLLPPCQHCRVGGLRRL